MKAIAFGGTNYEFDKAFWSDGGETVQSLIIEIERLQGALKAWDEGCACGCPACEKLSSIARESSDV